MVISFLYSGAKRIVARDRFFLSRCYFASARTEMETKSYAISRPPWTELNAHMSMWANNSNFDVMFHPHLLHDRLGSGKYIAC